MKFFKITCILASTVILAGCHNGGTIAASNGAATKPYTEAKALVLETQPLRDLKVSTMRTRTHAAAITAPEQSHNFRVR